MKHKKIFRDIYLTSISFICGLMFIVQCGGGTSAIAQAISNALGVEYDNTSSSISSVTVQNAIDELDQRFPWVTDINNKVIGVLYEISENGWTIWNPDSKMFMDLDPVTGDLITPKPYTVYYSNDDCTGTKYFFSYGYAFNGLNRILTFEDTYYYPTSLIHIDSADAVGASGIVKSKGGSTQCSVITSNTPPSLRYQHVGGTTLGDGGYGGPVNSYSELKEVSVSDLNFEGPLQIGMN